MSQTQQFTSCKQFTSNLLLSLHLSSFIADFLLELLVCMDQLNAQQLNGLSPALDLLAVLRESSATAASQVAPLSILQVNCEQVQAQVNLAGLSFLLLVVIANLTSCMLLLLLLLPL